MSVTLFISFERPVDDVNPNDQDRVLLCRISEELDGIAGTLSVPPLSAFYSYDVSEVLGLIDDEDVRDQMRAEAKPTAWFEAADGLRTLRALQEYVAENGPVMMKKQDVTGRVLDELQNCADVLTAADKAGVRFRMHPGE